MLYTDKKNMSAKQHDDPEINKFQSSSWQKIGLILVSAAALCFEINLSRLFSVAQFYHFAFMVVSIALLGFGASGTFLAVRRTGSETPLERNLAWLAGGAGFCMLGSYLLTNWLPFDSFSMAVDRKQIAILMLHYAALASPFFFSGMITSLLLSRYSASSGQVYALNLLGSAAGCLAAVLAPALVGGEGVVTLSSALAGLGGISFFIASKNSFYGKIIQKNMIALVLIAITAFASVSLGVRILSDDTPELIELHLSPYKSISYALQNPEARTISSRWNSFSRVDVVSSPSLHSIAGLSYRYMHELPRMDGLFVDGDNLSALLPAASDAGFANYLPAAIAYQLRPGGQALILKPLGGLDVLAALALGAGRVTAVEENTLIIAAAEDIYTHPGVELVISSGRSYLRSSEESFDIIQLPLTDSYHPVSSGAYSLGEDHRYTVESMLDMLERLGPDGLLVLTRWLQEQPSEWLRTFALAVTALEKRGADPRTQIIALRGYNTGTLLVKNSSFNSGELDAVRRFASDKAYDLVFAVDIQEQETNRFNILQEEIYFQTFQELIKAQPRADFYRTYRYDVRPPTDDHPFFGHYFKWSQVSEILRSLGKTWQPFGGAGYLVILAIFVLALVLAGVLILLPAAVIRRTGVHPGRNRIQAYFGLVGLAFLLVEMPLIQRFILYLDNPAYAMAAVLFCLLLFSGLGSRWGSQKLALPSALLLLLVVLLTGLLLLPRVLYATLGLPLAARLSITILLIAPIGFFMGIPFPAGLEWLRSSIGHGEELSDGEMVARVWAVNGACSVVASNLASLMALSVGFSSTFALGIGCYLLAFILSILKKAEDHQSDMC